MSRQYPFALPLAVPAWVVSQAPSFLQQKGVWDELPVRLRNVIVEASNAGQGLEITESELNTISDSAWVDVGPILAQV